MVFVKIIALRGINTKILEFNDYLPIRLFPDLDIYCQILYGRQVNQKQVFLLDKQIDFIITEKD